MIDDGYTESWHGIGFRRLELRDREYLAMVVSEGHTGWEEWLFQPPRVDVSGPDQLNDESKVELFDLLMDSSSELHDLNNLRNGVELLLRRPLLARRTCELCKDWWFDPETDYVTRIGGKAVRRPSHAPVPCETNTGCEKGHHSDPVELSEKNAKAWKHYLDFRTVGCPHNNDSVLRRNWKIMGALVAKYGLPEVRETVHS